MSLFTEQKEDHVGWLHRAISMAFQKVKGDTQLIFQWIDHFDRKHQEADQRIQALEGHVRAQRPLSAPDIHRIVQQYYPQNTSQRLLQLEQTNLSHNPITRQEVRRIAENSVSYDHILRKIEEIHLRIDQIESQRNRLTPQRSSLKEKILRKITKNSRDYIKTTVLSLIKKYGSITGSQLREMIVEEQGLCSKSSFYRILEDVESSEDVQSVRDGKEKSFKFTSSILP